MGVYQHHSNRLKTQDTLYCIDTMGGKAAAKSGYFDKLKDLLQQYKSIFVVQVDNVSSQQMHEIRQSLRGEGVVLMGKNTMVRRAIKTFIADFHQHQLRDWHEE